MTFRKFRLDPRALEFSSSLHHDREIFEYDVLVNAAHCLTLLKGGHISEDEAREILRTLKAVLDSGFREDWEYEDVEEAIEAEVTKLCRAGSKMHTGLSRNDEVACCLRMFARDWLLKLASNVCKLRGAILKLASQWDSVMPGFTHMQHAQPTRLAHHLLAYHEMLTRDFERIMQAFKRVNLCPLGSAAFASSPYKIDRSYEAELLGFDGIVEHSEDAVSSRDFLIEAIFTATQTLLDLSRIAEEIVIFSTKPFSFIELPEDFASTSSIMPQKKNPDMAELTRANAARLLGNLTAAMGIYKATPFSYNRDFQEMNPLLYDSLKRATLACEVFAGMLSGIKFNTAAMQGSAAEGFAAATALADYLTINFGIPFRVAYKIVGRLGGEVSVEKLKIAAGEFGYELEIDEDEIRRVLDPENIVESRKNVGGTAKVEVERMISERLESLKRDERSIEVISERINTRLNRLKAEIQRLGVEF